VNVTDEHPLFNPRALSFDTPPLQHLEESIYQLLWNGATGIFVVGFARSGKTTALRRILAELKDRSLNPIPSLHFTTARRDTQSLLSLHKSLCQQFDVLVRSRDTPADMAKRMASLLREEAVKTNSNRLVLCIDDAQKLFIEQWDVFSEINTYLEYEPRIHLCLISVFDAHYAAPLLKKFSAPHFDYLRGRYMNRVLEFSGIRSAKELKKVLNAYDTQVYPNNSEVTYTETALPEAFTSGWRLSDQARLLWQVYCDHRPKGEDKNWGMQSVIDTVQLLLLDYLAIEGVHRLDEDLIEHCYCLVNPSVENP